MGAFRARQLRLSSHTRRIAIIVIYSRSRIPPPLWDLNLGKMCYLVPVNHPPSPTSLNTHCEDPSMAYSSAIPRQYVSTGSPTQHLQTPKKSTQLFEAKALDRIPMCPQERLVLISISTGLCFAMKGLGHLIRLFVTSITCSFFCCLVKKPPKIPFLSIHRDFLLH